MSIDEKKLVVENEIETQEELIAQIQNVLKTKGSGGGGGEWTRPAEWPDIPDEFNTSDKRLSYFLLENTGEPIWFGIPNAQNADADKTISMGINVGGEFQAVITKPTSSTAANQRFEFSADEVAQLPKYFWVRGTGVKYMIGMTGEYCLARVLETYYCNIIGSPGLYSVNQHFYTPFTLRTVFRNCSQNYSSYAFQFSSEIKEMIFDGVEFTNIELLNNDGATEIGKIVFKNCVLDNTGMIKFGNCTSRSVVEVTNFSSTQTVASLDNFASGSTGTLKMSHDSLMEFLEPITFASTVSCQFAFGKLRIPHLNFGTIRPLNVSTAYRMFDTSRRLESIEWGNIDFSNCTNFYYAFSQCTALTSLSFRGENIKPTTMERAFNQCFGLKTLDLSNFDFSDCTSFGSTFYNMYNLENLTFAPNAGISKAVGVGDSRKLTHDSLLSLFNALAPVSTATTVTIGTTNKAKLTADELKIATDKGWTVA